MSYAARHIAATCRTALDIDDLVEPGASADDEFESLPAWVAEAAFPEHRVYRAEAGLVFLLVVLDDPDAGLAVCCPLYYEPSEAETLRELAEADGELRTHVRRLSESAVTLTHEDVEPFLPE